MAQAEQVSLCDTVHVFISRLGIEVSSKVTETEYNVLLERYNRITLSNALVSSRNSSLTAALSSIRNTATEAYNTAVRVESSVGEQIGGISVSMVYDGVLLAGLFGLHYKAVTDAGGETTRYAYNAGTLEQSTLAWKNSTAGFFVSTDGGRSWGYGWGQAGEPVRTAILLEQTLEELDARYEKAGALTEQLLAELDERYGTATALSEELVRKLDARYEIAQKLSENLLSELDARYAPPITAGNTTPAEPKENALWVDAGEKRLKLWDGTAWQTIGYEPSEPTDPEPTEPETTDPDSTEQEPADPEPAQPDTPTEEGGVTDGDSTGNDGTE